VLNEAPRHEDVLEVEVQFHTFLTSELDGGEWVSFTPRPIYPKGRRILGQIWCEY